MRGWTGELSNELAAGSFSDAMPKSGESMNDPHVALLRYRFRSSDPLDTFDTAEAFGADVWGFELTLADGELRAEPHDHFPDEGSARAVLEPYLRAWEATAFIDGRHTIAFIFDRADIVDRDPRPGPLTISMPVVRQLISANDLTVSRQNRAYPSPDPSVVWSPLLGEIVARIQSYLVGEPLSTMAYWVYTRLDREYGGLAAIAAQLTISKEVLKTLRQLSSGPERKATGRPHPLTDDERAWIDAAVRAIARRVGEVAAGAAPPKLTMSNLPKL